MFIASRSMLADGGLRSDGRRLGNSCLAGWLVGCRAVWRSIRVTYPGDTGYCLLSNALWYPVSWQHDASRVVWHPVSWQHDASHVVWHPVSWQHDASRVLWYPVSWQYDASRVVWHPVSWQHDASRVLWYPISWQHDASRVLWYPVSWQHDASRVLWYPISSQPVSATSRVPSGLRWNSVSRLKFQLDFEGPVDSVHRVL